MFNFASSTQRIFVVDHRVDFRLRHNGLLTIAYSLNLDPFRGDVVVFVSRNRREVRVLHGDPTGIWLHSKIFTEQSIRTQFSFLYDPSCRKITSGDLAMLLEGAAYEVKKRLKPLELAA
jgi:IS66 Orf2 like protein